MVKTINLKEIIDKRFSRIMFITEATTRKLVKRELKKLKKDILREIKGF